MVTASPLRFGSAKVAMAVFQDIGSEKRRDVLERVFLHDLLNTAAGITGTIDLLDTPDLAPDESEFFHRQLSTLASNLVEEIRAHRQVSDAEHGTVRVQPARINVRNVLTTTLTAHAADMPGRTVRIGLVPDLDITTDVVMLRRILTNLLRNALEASGRGDAVTVWCEAHDETIRFCIQNPVVMANDVQRQVFQRSFTTKAEAGHGLGTYSARLFTEKYLKGRLTFHSAEPGGTVFSVTLPRELH